MLFDRRNGFQPPDDKLPRRPFDDLLRDFGFDVVLVGLGAPDETPDELPPDNVDTEPFDDVVMGFKHNYLYNNKNN